MLPFVSVPIATDARLAATATADPELDPHGLRSSTYGFFVCPPRELHPDVDRVERKFAHSLRLARPRMTTPASRTRRITNASALGRLSTKRQRSSRVDHAGDVDVVLHENRDAVQRPANLAGLPLGIARLGVLNRGGIDVDHRIELRPGIVNRSNAIEIGASQRTRGERPCRHAPLRLGDAQIDDVDRRAGALCGAAAGCAAHPI